jgi:hypothetical protein
MGVYRAGVGRVDFRAASVKSFVHRGRREAYTDEVSVFLNGQILYRGHSAQKFRDPDFPGIVNLGNDAVYLPLKKGRNELVLAVSDIGGGWGFICSLDDLQK